VEDHTDAVGGGLDVDLDDVGALVKRRANGGDGVLPERDRVAAVSDRQRPAVLPGPREQMLGAQSRDPSR
jgi:hypothetical protein